MLFDQPLAGPTQPQARAVHQQVNRPCGERAWFWNLQGLGAAAQDRMIRDSEIKTEQPENLADQTLRPTQRQPEHRPERQGCLDRQGRIVRLTTACRAGLGPPSGNCLLREPDREAAPLAEGSVVFHPVCHPVPLVGDAMTASGIGFERHGRDPT